MISGVELQEGYRAMVRFWTCVRAAGVGAALTLAACQSGPGVEVDAHTGTKAAHSGVVTAYQGLFDFMNVQAFHSNKDGFGLIVSYGGQDWLFPRAAWSYGTRLPFHATTSAPAMCSGSGCMTLENGVIRLSESQFRKAAKDGLTFELVGTAGKRVAKVPAKAFQVVLNQGL